MNVIRCPICWVLVEDSVYRDHLAFHSKYDQHEVTCNKRKYTYRDNCSCAAESIQ